MTGVRPCASCTFSSAPCLRRSRTLCVSPRPAAESKSSLSVFRSFSLLWSKGESAIRRYPFCKRSPLAACFRAYQSIAHTVKSGDLLTKLVILIMLSILLHQLVQGNGANTYPEGGISPGATSRAAYL